MSRILKPVREVEVDRKNFKLRVILLIVCISAAVVFLGYGISLLVNKQSGWQTVGASCDQVNCSADFSLQYYMDSSGAAAQYRELSLLYAQACEDAAVHFYRDGELAKVNAAPNADVTVSPELYGALELIQAAGNRCLYLAPVYTEYNRIFLCENEVEAAQYDPGRDNELAAELLQLAQWCNDPAMVDLELKGNNTVRLKVAGAYLTYAQEYEQEIFLDFGWMTNAFIADFIANILAKNGFTQGSLSSYDGFTRNLYSGDQTFRLNIFDRQDNGINKPAVMEYAGPMSIVSLRDYPMTTQDRWHYFAFSDGRIVTAYVDPADGVSKSALHNLLVYAPDAGCAQLALEASAVYLQDAFRPEALQALAAEKMYALWSQGRTLCYNEQNLTLEMTDNSYTKEYIVP